MHGILGRRERGQGEWLPPFVSLAGKVDFDASEGARVVIMPDSRQVRSAYPLYGSVQNFP